VDPYWELPDALTGLAGESRLKQAKPAQICREYLFLPTGVGRGQTIYMTKPRCRPVVDLDLVALHPVVTVVAVHPGAVVLHPVVRNESQTGDRLARKTGIGEAKFIAKHGVPRLGTPSRRTKVWSRHRPAGTIRFGCLLR
jgi:hypothetical protein